MATTPTRPDEKIEDEERRQARERIASYEEAKKDTVEGKRETQKIRRELRLHGPR